MDKFAAFQISTQFFGRVANPSLSSKFKDYLFRFKSKIRSTDLLDALYFLIFQDESFEKTYDEFAHSRFLDNFVHFRTDSFDDDEEDYEDENFATGDPFNTNDPYHNVPFVRDGGSKKIELPELNTSRLTAKHSSGSSSCALSRFHVEYKAELSIH